MAGKSLQLILLLLVMFASWQPFVAAQSPSEGSAIAVAHALVAAFNRHDPDAMALLVTDDFELFYVSEAGVPVLGSAGADGLRADMTEYFESRPSVRSTVADEIAGPTYVSFREQIVGGDSSIAVYEVRDGLVRRAWYFPAERGG